MTGGAAISVTVANGPGNATDWVGLYPTAAGDDGYVAWQYLNGSTTAPATGLTGATLQFTAPLTPGTYNLRLFSSNSYTKLATSYVVTVVDVASAESMASNVASAKATAIDATLAAYWPLDDGTGSPTVYDASGNGMNGTLVNGPVWTTGRIGAGLSFDGINDHVTTNLVENLPTWTVVAWVWSPAAPSAAPASGPVQRDRNLQINWNHEDAALRGAVGVSVGGTWYGASFGALAANTWYHLAGTYDGETLRAYVNGVLVTANRAPSGEPDFEPAALEFGARAGAPQYFSGTIDEVRIYRRVLSAAEITGLLVQPDATPPTAVTLTAVTVGQAVALSWAAAADPESGIGAYRLYRGTTADGSKTLLVEVSGTTVSYQDRSAAPLTSYYYQVAAVNGSGLEGPRSNEAGAATGDTAY